MIAFYENNKMPMRSFPFTDLNFSAHLHKEIELLYVQEGEVTATLNDVAYSLRPGDLLVMLPNTIHSYFSTIKNSGILTVFSPELTAEFHYKLTHFFCSCPLLTQDKMSSDIPYCIRRLTFVEASPENLNLIRGYLLVLLSRILSSSRSNRLTAAKISTCSTGCCSMSRSISGKTSPLMSSHTKRASVNITCPEPFLIKWAAVSIITSTPCALALPSICLKIQI